MGKTQSKKDLPFIVAAHGVPYVAIASVAYLKDLQKKVKKAMGYHGPRYIQVHTPCPSVWGFPSDRTLEIGRLAVNSALVPLFEMEWGKVISIQKIKKKIPVTDYLKSQKRFSHLFKKDQGDAELASIQAIANQHIEKFGLLARTKTGS